MAPSYQEQKDKWNSRDEIIASGQTASVIDKKRQIDCSLVRWHLQNVRDAKLQGSVMLKLEINIEGQI